MRPVQGGGAAHDGEMGVAYRTNSGGVYEVTWGTKREHQRLAADALVFMEHKFPVGTKLRFPPDWASSEKEKTCRGEIIAYNVWENDSDSEGGEVGKEIWRCRWEDAEDDDDFDEFDAATMLMIWNDNNIPSVSF